jgi:arylsulfatase A-like enzyme
VQQFFAGASAKPGAMLGRYLRKMRAPRLMFDTMSHWFNSCDDHKPLFLMTNITNIHYPWALPAKILWSKLGWDVRYLRTNAYTTLAPFSYNSGKIKLTDTHRRIWARLYDAAITHVDQEVGRFLHKLRRSPKWSNTVVIVTADHGELLGDYKNIVGHTLCLHDHLIHVPLIIRHPDYATGLTVEGVVQTVDLYASIIKWLNLPHQHVPTSQKQRPPWSDAIDNANDQGGIAFAEEDYTDSYNVIRGLLGVNPDMNPQKYPRQQIAVHSAKYKYIWFDDRPGEFYDLEMDPLEALNLFHTAIPAKQQALQSLQKALTDWRSTLELLPPRCLDKTTETESELLAHLRDLGYVA